MSGNAYRSGNTWKYMIARSKKAFKASIHSETHLHQSQIIKILLILKNIKSLSKNQKNLKKNDKVSGDIIKN